MAAHETFEEKVGQALDALFDGATLLTGNLERAEALVVSVVVDAARRRERQLDGERFRRWIVGRMVRSYIEYREEQPERSAVIEPAQRATPDGDPAAWERPGPELDETGVEGLLRNLEALSVSAERLGRVIRAQMMRLGTEERVALWLVNVLGFGYSEAAAALEIGRPELRQRLYRGRRELQARLAVALREDPLPESSDRRDERRNGGGETEMVGT